MILSDLLALRELASSQESFTRKSRFALPILP